MQPEYQTQSKAKIQRHATNIRRDARQRIIQQKRNEVYFETQPISKIAEEFALPPKMFGEYTIIEILSIRYAEILNVGSKLVEMAEQSRNGIQNSSVNVGAHVNFWAFLLQEFFTERIKIDQKIQQFFIEFEVKNPYVVLATHKMLQLKVLNTLEVAIFSANDANRLKAVSLKWVQGTDGLTLIYNSLPNYFLCPSQFSNVYRVTIQALKFTNLQKVSQSCEIVKQIMKGADFDDTYRIYTQQSDLMVELLSRLSQLVEDNSIQSQVDAIIYLMDSYNSLIFDYARMGVALLGTRMIICRRETNVLKGLQIIKFISEVQDTKAMKFLLEDRQLNEAGLWHTIFNTDQILLSSNLSIKREAYIIFANIMANSDYNCIELLNKKIKHYQQKQLIDLIQHGLKMEEDLVILRSVLRMLNLLLYYSQEFGSDSESQGEEEKFTVKIMQKILSMDIEQQVKKLTMHKNQQLAQSAAKVCNDIQFVLSSLSTV